MPLGSIALTINRTPPNCTFEVDDFEQDWVYRNKFDYIHARELGGCVADDGQLFRRAFEHLVPGGYLEMQLVYPRFLSDDDTAKLATDAQFWMTNICEGAGKFGKPLDSAPQLPEKMRAAGFVDVQQEIRKVCPTQSIHENLCNLKCSTTPRSPLAAGRET